MIVLNFSHPFSEQNKAEIEQLTGIPQDTIEIIDISIQFDPAKSFVQQTKDLFDHIPFDFNLWQVEPVLINPPAYNWIALTVISEIHGRVGSFPPVMRLSPVHNEFSTTYQVVEIINLNQIRENARKTR